MGKEKSSTTIGGLDERITAIHFVGIKVLAKIGWSVGSSKLLQYLLFGLGGGKIETTGIFNCYISYGLDCLIDFPAREGELRPRSIGLNNRLHNHAKIACGSIRRKLVALQ